MYQLKLHAFFTLQSDYCSLLWSINRDDKNVEEMQRLKKSEEYTVSFAE
jgi:hypothetical protein